MDLPLPKARPHYVDVVLHETRESPDAGDEVLVVLPRREPRRQRELRECGVEATRLRDRHPVRVELDPPDPILEGPCQDVKVEPVPSGEPGARDRTGPLPKRP